MDRSRHHSAGFRLIAGAVLACAFTGCGDRGVNPEWDDQLRLHLGAGNSFTLVQQIFTQTTMTVGDNDLSIHENGELEYEFRVDEVDKQGNLTATVTVKIANIDTAWNELGRHIQGKSFRFVFEPTGHLSEVIGLDEIMAELKADFDLPDWTAQSGVPETESQRKVRNDILDVWGNEALRDSFNMMMCPLPISVVEAGDVWTPERQAFFGTDIYNEPSYLIEEIRRDKIGVSYESTIISTQGSEKSFVTGEGVGRFVISKKKGFMREGEMRYAYTGQVAVENEGAEPRWIPIAYEATIRVETSGL